MNNFVIKDTPGKGKGLFATKNFKKDEILFKFEGKPLTYEQIVSNNTPKEVFDRYIQIGINLFLDVEEHYSVFTNHCCNPNTYVKIMVNMAFLAALYPIVEGNEITFDYSTTSTETADTWMMPCNCSVFYCRKNITGFSSLSAEKQTELIKNNLVPSYIKELYGK